MADQHPITPPPELVASLRNSAPHGIRDAGVTRELHLIAAAYAAGADQELEACCEWLERNYNYPRVDHPFRATRRPRQVGPPMTEPLSPAAAAVLRAAGDSEPGIYATIAAALRAAADQKLPQTNEPNRSINTEPERDVVFIGAWHIWNTENRIRRELLAIAAELEGQ